MRTYRPKSIVRMILFGFAIVSLPLIAAIVTAVVQVDRLAESSRDTVLEAEFATQESRVLVDSLTEMQRALGQFQVVGSDAVYQIYLDRRTAFSNAATNLATLELTNTGREALQYLVREEQVLFDKQRGEATASTSAGLAPEWTDLARSARTVLAESSQLIAQNSTSTTDTAAQLQGALLLQAATVIPVTVAVAFLFLALVTGPIRQLSAAIRRLGASDFSTPIEIRGPQDLEDLGEQLDWLRRRITELENQKTTFLRHMSHELKTPLTTIREGAELLAEDLDHDASVDNELTEIIRENSLQLQKLIEDLLEFGKVQESITTLTTEANVSLTDIVRSTISDHLLTLRSKQLELEQILSDVQARGNANKLRIIVDNLVTNAIKYTPVGGKICVQLSKQNSDAVLDVSNSGPGIDEAERESIFEPFYQGQAAYQAHVKGTGLGLSIVKEYVEAHDGAVEVVDSEDGAHFRVRLPESGPAPEN
ncbi:MAG: ATP-binding protein [Gammaproteobacteria bacterium]